MSRKTNMKIIKKTVSELAESTEQINKFEVKMQINLQDKVTKSNNLKDRLNAFNLLVLQEFTQT